MIASSPVSDRRATRPGTKCVRTMSCSCCSSGRHRDNRRPRVVRDEVAYVGLLPFALALVLPTVFLKNFRLYWLAFFCCPAVLDQEDLNDGLAVVDALKLTTPFGTLR